MKAAVRFVLFAVVIFFSIQAFAAQKADFIIVIDQSKSIKESLPSIKDFVSKRIFNRVAHPEDSVHLLSFDGLFYEREVLPGDADIFDIGYSLDSIQPVGGYTDLANAIVSMNNYIKTNTDPRSRKIVFFLTDGLNEPPEYSKYKGELKPSFFTEAQKQRKDGNWTVFVTGIGEDTHADKLAGYIEAEYVEMKTEPSLADFDTHISPQMEEARNRKSMLPYYIAGASVILLCGAGSTFMLKRTRSV